MMEYAISKQEYEKIRIAGDESGISLETASNRWWVLRPHETALAFPTDGFASHYDYGDGGQQRRGIHPHADLPSTNKNRLFP